MSGLLESIILGGSKGYAQGTVDNIEQQKKADAEKEKLANEVAAKEASAQKMLGIELGMREEYAQRAEEHKQKRDIADTASIRTETEKALASRSMGGLLDGAGTGAKVSAEDLRALKDNPEAIKEYSKAGAKDLLNNTRQDVAEESATQSLNIGRSDFANKFEAEAKGERADAALAQAAKQSQRNFERTLSMQAAQFAKADKAADIKGKEDAIKAVVETAKGIKVELSDLLTQRDDQTKNKAEIAAIDENIKGLRESLSNANKWMIKNSGIAPEKKAADTLSDRAKALIAAQDAKKDDAAKTTTVASKSITEVNPQMRNSDIVAKAREISDKFGEEPSRYLSGGMTDSERNIVDQAKRLGWAWGN